MRKKILFFIHDLGQGGAEKVLVNLVNHLDRSIFDITVMALFGGGVNEKQLKNDVCFRTVFPRTIPANSRWMKLFSPKQLHNKYIKERYDIEVSYLEGPCARIISGCQDKTTKLVSWIHTKYTTERDIYTSFRSAKEARFCYERFDYTAFVSEDVKNAFCNYLALDNPKGVLYNTVESDTIKELSSEKCDITFDDSKFNLIAIGSLKPVKRYDRLMRIAERLKSEGYGTHTYLLGDGPLKGEFIRYIESNHLADYVTLLGYHTNPYKYLARCDLFVCSSRTEGFSTAATEALIVGTPVCTTNVSGMKEMLGENNEYGIVTENSEKALYEGIKKLFDNPKLLAHYKKKAELRGQMFGTETTVKAVEKMLLSL